MKLRERLSAWFLVGDPGRLIGLHPDAPGVCFRMNSRPVASQIIPYYRYSCIPNGFLTQSGRTTSQNTLTFGRGDDLSKLFFSGRCTEYYFRFSLKRAKVLKIYIDEQAHLAFDRKRGVWHVHVL